MSLARLRNRAISKLTTRMPFFAKIYTDSFNPIETDDIPWKPIEKPLNESKIALITTAGVHHRNQLPFDMNDREGDPTFRLIDAFRPIEDLMITHDYYDHSDADKDINIVFPIQRMREFEKKGIIGELGENHYGFMGHILGKHIDELMHASAPAVAEKLLKDNIDIVFLTPG